MKARRHIRRLRPSAWGYAALFWVGLCLLLLGLAQIVLPAASEAEESGIREFYGNAFEPFFLPDTDGAYKNANKNLWPASFAVPKPEKTLRVFIVGGSVAQGLRSSPHFTAFARGLTRLHKGRRVEIIDAGIVAYDSSRALQVVKEVARYSPDILIILSGNNEFYPRPLSAANRCFWRLRKLKLLRLLAAAAGGGNAPRDRTRRLADYAANIAAMTRIAQNCGARTVLCTLPLNIADFAPKGPFPADRNYVRGMLAFWRGETPRAIAALGLSARKNPADANVLFALGRALLKDGRPNRARVFLGAAMDIDYGMSDRACPLANALVRKTAKTSGAALADLDRAYSRLWLKSGGSEAIFRDNCHLREKHRPLVFDSILSSLAGTRTNIIPMPDRGLPDARPLGHLYAFVNESLDSPDEFLTPNSFSRVEAACRELGARKAAELLKDRVALSEALLKLTGRNRCGANWTALDMHAGEAMRRLGKPGLARKFLKNAQESGYRHWPLFLSIALLENDAGDGKEARRYAAKAEKLAKTRALPAVFRRCLFENAGNNT